MTRYPGLLKGFVDFTILLLGSWTVYAHSLVGVNSSFSSLAQFGFVPLTVASVLFYILKTDGKDQSRTLGISGIILTSERWSSLREIILIVAIVAFYAISEIYLLFWTFSILFLVYILVSYKDSIIENDTAELPEKKWHIWGVLILSLLAVIVTLIAHRPDKDDTFYLSLIHTSINHPDWVLLKYDGMYGEENLSLLSNHYRVVTYELLIATITKWSGTNPLFLYYIIFPSIFAFLTMNINWLTLRLFDKKNAMYGLLIIFLVLLFWGDSHRTFGNFSFVRLFQGKAIFLTVIVPSIIMYCLQYYRNPNIRSWIFLTMVQIVAVGFTSTGIFIAPLVVGTTFLGLRLTNLIGSKTFIIGLFSSFYVVTAGVILTVNALNTDFLSTVDEVAKESYFDSGIHTLIGNELRAFVVFFFLLFVCVTTKRLRTGKIILGIILINFLIILNPWTSKFLYDLLPNLSWRIIWSIPIPLIIGLCSMSFLNDQYNNGTIRLGQLFLLILTGAFILSPGSHILSLKNNGTIIQKPQFKLDYKFYNIALEATQITPKNGLILAPWQVSTWIPAISGHQRTLVTRPPYLGIIRRSLGNEEEEKRLMLIDFLEGKISQQYIEAFIGEVEDRNISTILLRRNASNNQIIREELLEYSFTMHESDNYEIWVKNP